MSQTNDPLKKSPAEMMREMRLKQLTMAPSELGQKPTAEFPKVCAVLMDWPIEAQTITVVARTTGDASIYTTGTFGVLGGVGHEPVRVAATNFISVAEKHFDTAKATSDFSYPKTDHVRFYLVGYGEVRMIDRNLEAVRSGRDNCSDLYEAAQRVITELRLITQHQKGER